MRGCSLRLTNVYGPRQLVRHNRQGFIGWFIRLAVEGREIQVYGDGSQLRDFVYVDDAADAFLRAGASDACNGEVFNVGGLEPVSHRDLVELLIATAGSGSVRYVEWPPEKKAIDIGSFYADSDRFTDDGRLGADRVALREGLARTIAYYREHLAHYVDPADPATGSAARPQGRRDAAARALHGPAPWRGRRRRRRGHPPRRRARLVRARPRGGGVRGGVRRRVGAGFAVGVGTGTDAIALALQGARIRPRRRGRHHAALGRVHGAGADDDRDARRCSPTSIPDRLTLDPQAVEAAIGPRTVAIMPVHLYGQPADMDADCRHRAAPRTWRSSRTAVRLTWPPCGGRPVGTFGVAAAWSFYPTKNLGALGDGGAVTTGDAALAARLKRLRNGGQTDRYHHVEPGHNSRLDEMQAAILRARLRDLPRWTGADGALSRRSTGVNSPARRSRCRPSSTQGTSTTSSRCCPTAASSYRRT